eukprot:GHUV01056328.1.p1 GENE.GHUV01056328.1~~GHUV01056328.1.p1  ORF type:complete len:134 (-),score=35.58 GHUV01056328.1:124-525(-)
MHSSGHKCVAVTTRNFLPLHRSQEHDRPTTLCMHASDVKVLHTQQHGLLVYGGCRRLADLNRDMWVEHDKRAVNQQQLVDGLKRINLMIQQAARLRVGAAASRVVAACRAAIKANNLQALNKVVTEGDSTVVA